MMKQYPWTLKEFLQETAIVRQNIRLASGKETDYYIDCRRAVMHPLGARLVYEELFKVLQTYQRTTQVGGLATGAIPLVCAMSKFYNGFYVRRETKPYGLSQEIEGSYDPQEPTAILEDVVTTGDSIRRVIKVLEENRTEITVIIALVDRQEGAGDFGYPYKAIYTARELLGE